MIIKFFFREKSVVAVIAEKLRVVCMDPHHVHQHIVLLGKLHLAFKTLSDTHVQVIEMHLQLHVGEKTKSTLITLKEFRLRDAR